MSTCLRQITTCTDTATMVSVRRSRCKDRERDYTVYLCARHRWLTDTGQWGWGRESGRVDDPAAPRCGTVADYRDFEAILESHFRLWLSAEPVDGRPHVVTGWVERLRVCYQTKFEWLGDLPQYQSVLVALGHAVRLAEAIDAGAADVTLAKTQILAALAIAETLDAQQRGA